MRDTAGKLADRFHLLAVEQRLTRPLELALGLLALGNVAGHTGKADGSPVVVANGVDHHACPEALAVLANAPPIRKESPFLASDFQRLAGFFPLAVFVGVEAGIVLSDDLVRLVARDAARAFVPAGYVPLRIE